MATGRARSESPFMAEEYSDFQDFQRQPGSERNSALFHASSARKKAEQDSILLANRIRLLRNEEAKTRKKIAETEKKTQEIIESRRRNEERRIARDAFEAHKQALTEEFRAGKLQERAIQQQKIQDKQRHRHLENHRAGEIARRQREAHRLSLESQKAAEDAEAFARAEQVRASAAQAARSRARSEGAKQEFAKDVVRERMLREEDERRHRMLEIEKMEKEEAELMHRLQRSQERHKAAYMQLEDVLHQSGQAGASTGLSPSGSLAGALSTGSMPASEASGRLSRSSLPPCHTPSGRESVSSKGSRSRPGDAPSYLREASEHSSAASGSTSAARPPRPRGPPAMRPGSASRYAVPKLPASTTPTGAVNGDAVDRLRQKHSASAMSSCSTASGPETVRGAHGSGHSTPCSAAAMGAQQIRYTTVDGLELEIPAEEDLDLAALLNGR
eukprot:TRINITY_DN61150_c0_g1_i1.p1 TRINITY_DN61150_c0_g1~~TRINITY_DN61150_c0_g1_i1.p1  ORF type:complete len:445 (-),score=101.57 TRINITY_DN61150_c0_g1_i1:119-1453(-)